jgi:hypothetical protein
MPGFYSNKKHNCVSWLCFLLCVFVGGGCNVAREFGFDAKISKNKKRLTIANRFLLLS